MNVFMYRVVYNVVINATRVILKLNNAIHVILVQQIEIMTLQHARNIYLRK